MNRNCRFNNAKQDHKSDYFIVTEGYMDVIMLSQYGVNAVCWEQHFHVSQIF